MPKFGTIALAIAAIVLAPAAFGANVARPGTVNYVEGAASLDGQQVSDKSVGDVDLNPGQELTTAQGKAEILLTPGVFLRLDDNSTVKMISPDLTHTQVELEHGRAGIEVDEVHPENNLDIEDAGVTTQLLKNGYYEFNADQPTAMVFDGKAAVEIGDGKYKVVKSHHELALVAGPNDKPLVKEKPAGFDVNAARDDLYNWNSLRSQYLAEANNQIAGEYAGGPGFVPGWYWDPSMWDYTFIGGGPFYSPFGWGFYPFGWGGWYGGGWYGGRFYGHKSIGRVGEPGHHPAPRGGFHGGAGFRGSAGVAGGFHGEGFHGGMGGGVHGGGGGHR
ncbi:MAG: FecR domain-containing protein [Terracidiphilus sp.]